MLDLVKKARFLDPKLFAAFATAAEVHARLPEAERAGRHWVLVATAHAAKFREIVEPLVAPVPVPQNLQHLYDLPSRFSEIGSTLSELRRATGD